MVRVPTSGATCSRASRAAQAPATAIADGSGRAGSIRQTDRDGRPPLVGVRLFEIDGTKPSGGGSTALTATLASGSLVSEAPNAKRYVENLWSVAQQSGQYRYYQECVYLLGLLATAGRYHYDWASPTAAARAN